MFSKLFLYSYLLFVLTISIIDCKQDLCGHKDIDLSLLNHATIWDLTHNESDGRKDFAFSLCKPFDKSDPISSECYNKTICVKTSQIVIGYEPTQVITYPELGIELKTVLFDGPVCDFDKSMKYTIRMRFTCGPHLEYPKYNSGSRCRTTLEWRTSAACPEKQIHNEVKCYVYDQNGKRRDLTPLIKPKGDYYKVLSANQDFYINVCSDASSICSGNGSGACIRDGSGVLQTVGDYRWYSIEYKPKSAILPNDHIEMIYKTKSNACNNRGNGNSTANTIIRFICPSKNQRRSAEYANRSPKLVSDLDCEYQIDWLTEFACPAEDLEVDANKCELIESKHGYDFNLEALLRRRPQQEFYKISNITTDGTKNVSFDIYFNVCGGLGDFKCGVNEWKTKSVCLKSKDGKNDKVIGFVNQGKLRFADNRLTLRYMTKDSTCKLDGNNMTESTLIEFFCDRTNGPNFIGKPEFVSFEDCTYSIIWNTSYVCPIITSTTPCSTSHNGINFDLSLLRRGPESEPWTVGVVQQLPWSKYAKSVNDNIYINICGLIPNTVKTPDCDYDSSACMTIGNTNITVNLGKFSSPPIFNEDNKALELNYDNGFDPRKNFTVKTNIMLHCKPGKLDSSPVLIDIDEDDINGKYSYHLEWETAAACPIDAIQGTDNCKVYDKFFDYTFDLNELKHKEHYSILTDKYDFQINVCDSVKSESCNTSKVPVEGPFGACQVEKDGDKRAFSLGKANYSLIYWNGILNLTFTDGSPYRNPEKTPRKSHIAFICDPNAGKGHPEFDGEKDRAYFFRWYTSLACPHTPKITHCVWDNGSHILDLTELALTQGNYFTYSMSNSGKEQSSAIYYINICRPLNPIHAFDLSLCGPNSAACKLDILSNNSVMNLGETSHPPITGFDGSISLFYDNGSPCPTNPSKRVSTRIKFDCDIHGDLHDPIVIEPGSDQIDGEECVYVFEFKTAAVCNALQPTQSLLDSCLFTDPRTNLSVDFNQLKIAPTDELYKVYMSQNRSTFAINICGTANEFKSPVCADSAICLKTSNQTILSYGSLRSSSFFMDGKDLKLKYFNGSKCSHSDTGRMSTEIVFKCNPNARNGSPKLYSYHSCIAVFHWETELVCNLQLPKCSIVNEKDLYNLRQLSSISHAWNATDKDRNVYFLNVCGKLSNEYKCGDHSSASCKCSYDSKDQLVCSESLGQSSSEELSFNSDGRLVLKYKNGSPDKCDRGMTAQTEVVFKCGELTGSPRFDEFVKSECLYRFYWKTFMACPVNSGPNIRLIENNRKLEDTRLHALIDIKFIYDTTFKVEEIGRKENYTYVINLSNSQFGGSSLCANAAVCQTKLNSDFARDVGSIGSQQFYLRGQELQIVLSSLSPKKCGRNKDKNVTTIIRLFCSSTAGIGKPKFLYESDDCDYIFMWDTANVCLQRLVNLDIDTVEPINKSIDENSKQNQPNHSRLWIGVFIILCIVVTLSVLLVYKQRARQSLMFRFRRLFTPETEHTFHYHQISL